MSRYDYPSDLVIPGDFWIRVFAYSILRWGILRTNKIAMYEDLEGEQEALSCQIGNDAIQRLYE